MLQSPPCAPDRAVIIEDVRARNNHRRASAIYYRPPAAPDFSGTWTRGRGPDREGTVKFSNVRLTIPADGNIIVGQSHFIKTVEDLSEIIATGVPRARFGIAFCEASGPCLIRVDGNDARLREVAAENAGAIGAGHTFVVMLEDAFPINVLNAVKHCPEVCHIFCATANPLEVIVAETDQGRGIVGVVDGLPPRGVETESDAAARKEFLRKIGYKR